MMLSVTGGRGLRNDHVCEIRVNHIETPVPILSAACPGLSGGCPRGMSGQANLESMWFTEISKPIFCVFRKNFFSVRFGCQRSHRAHFALMQHCITYRTRPQWFTSVSPDFVCMTCRPHGLGSICHLLHAYAYSLILSPFSGLNPVNLILGSNGLRSC